MSAISFYLLILDKRTCQYFSALAASSALEATDFLFPKTLSEVVDVRETIAGLGWKAAVRLTKAQRHRITARIDFIVIMVADIVLQWPL